MNVTNFLSTITFLLLFSLMLLYWSQAAFFGKERYKILNNFVFLLAILSLTMLLVLRWIESGHFPLSNLYESLLFLSWSFLSVAFLFSFKGGNLGSFLGFSKRNSLLDPARPLCPSTFGEGARGSVKGHTTRILDLLNQSKIDVLHRNASTEQARTQEVETSEKNQNSASGTRKQVVLQYSTGATKNPIFLESSNLGLGVVLSPLSLLTFGFAFLSLPREMQQSTALVPALQSNWLMMHVTVMILSYAALLSGSILSIAFLILTRLRAQRTRNLEKKGLSASSLENQVTVSYNREKLSADPKVERLQPSILCIESQSFGFTMPVENGQSVVFTGQREKQNNAEFQTEQGKSETDKNTLLYSNVTTRLDNYSYRILALGFPLLTIGILSGAVWANEAWGSYWSWDPKETWALITWLVFAIYLHTRITKGWSGEKPAIVASLGFLMVWFCYLGVNLLGTGLHSYGWFSSV